MSTYTPNHSFDSLRKDEFEEALSNLRGSYFELDNPTITFLIELSKYVETGTGVNELINDAIDYFIEKEDIKSENI